MRAHFLSTSKGTEADFYKKLRIAEACVHQSLLTDFLQRNRQLQAHEIDARGSNMNPPTYYDKVADLVNSDIILYTINMGTDYGAPFHEVLELKPSRQSISGYDVKQFLLGLKRPFSWIQTAINFSSSGQNMIPVA
jgi:hypothetical protein